MPNSQWSPEQDRRLATLYATGAPVNEIAAQLGCSASSIRTRASTLGLLRRRIRSRDETLGNAKWLVGAALADVMKVPADDFCADLLTRLDAIAT